MIRLAKTKTTKPHLNEQKKFSGQSIHRQAYRNNRKKPER